MSSYRNQNSSNNNEYKRKVLKCFHPLNVGVNSTNSAAAEIASNVKSAPMQTKVNKIEMLKKQHPLPQPQPQPQQVKGVGQNTYLPKNPWRKTPVAPLNPTPNTIKTGAPTGKPVVPAKFQGFQKSQWKAPAKVPLFNYVGPTTPTKPNLAQEGITSLRSEKVLVDTKELVSPSSTLKPILDNDNISTDAAAAAAVTIATKLPEFIPECDDPVVIPSTYPEQDEPEFNLTQMVEKLKKMTEKIKEPEDELADNSSDALVKPASEQPKDDANADAHNDETRAKSPSRISNAAKAKKAYDSDLESDSELEDFDYIHEINKLKTIAKLSSQCNALREAIKNASRKEKAPPAVAVPARLIDLSQTDDNNMSVFNKSAHDDAVEIASRSSSDDETDIGYKCTQLYEPGDDSTQPWIIKDDNDEDDDDDDDDLPLRRPSKKQRKDDVEHDSSSQSSTYKK